MAPTTRSKSKKSGNGCCNDKKEDLKGVSMVMPRHTPCCTLKNANEINESFRRLVVSTGVEPGDHSSSNAAATGTKHDVLSDIDKEASAPNDSFSSATSLSSYWGIRTKIKAAMKKLPKRAPREAENVEASNGPSSAPNVSFSSATSWESFWGIRTTVKAALKKLPKRAPARKADNAEGTPGIAFENGTFSPPRYIETQDCGFDAISPIPLSGSIADLARSGAWDENTPIPMISSALRPSDVQNHD